MELQRCHPTGASTHFTMVSWQRTESNGSYRCFVWQFSIYTAWKFTGRLYQRIQQISCSKSTGRNFGHSMGWWFPTLWNGVAWIHRTGRIWLEPNSTDSRSLQSRTCPTRIWLSSKWQPYGFSGWTGTRSIFLWWCPGQFGKAQSGMGNYWFYFNQPTGSRRTGSMEPYLPTKNSPSKGGTKTIWKNMPRHKRG